MGRKQVIDSTDREACQKVLKKFIHRLIKRVGLVAAEYQVEYLADHPVKGLPTILTHRETVREYRLVIKEYKDQQNEKTNSSEALQSSIDIS